MTVITSPQNEKLKLIRRLQRRRARDRDGLFVTEGEDLLAAAGTAGAEPVELLTAAGEGLGGTEVEPELLDRFSALGSGTRAIGVWEQAWAAEAVAPCIYLHGVSDPGNVGTLLRTADAFGAAVSLSAECADPLGPRALRASAGAIFRVPVVGWDDLPERRVALVAHDAIPLAEVELEPPLAFLLGSEREGLPNHLATQGHMATIPFPGGAESLNVAAAGAIALYELSRRTRS